MSGPTTFDVDDLRVALEIAGRIVNGSLGLDAMDEEITAVMDTEEIDEDRREVLETLVRSFHLFGRNVRIGRTTD